MAAPRATVTIGGLELVADIGQYRPFTDLALGVTVFTGIDATTIQDFGFRADRQQGALSSGSGTSPGLLTTARLAELIALVDTWGAAQSIEDSLGNAGTIKVMSFAPPFEYHIPGGDDAHALHSYALTWRWLTLTTRYGVAYTGP